MQRLRTHAVTHPIAVLIHATTLGHRGPVSYLPGTEPPVAVREFAYTDSGEVGTLLRSLEREDREHWLAVVQLMGALERRDPLALKKTTERFSTALHARRKWDEGIRTRESRAAHSSFGSVYSQLLGLGPDQEEKALDIWEGYALSPREKNNPTWLLGRQLLDKLAGVQLRAWWDGRRFLPALYCPNPAAALYVYALLRFVVGKGFAVCPHCALPFTQQRRDQEYCCIAHREAHRVARWREKQRRELKKRRKTK